MEVGEREREGGTERGTERERERERDRERDRERETGRERQRERQSISNAILFLEREYGVSSTAICNQEGGQG